MSLFYISDSNSIAGNKYYSARPGYEGSAARRAQYGSKNVYAKRLSRSSSTEKIDVYGSFDWSTTPYPTWQESDRSLIPYGHLKEYRVPDSTVWRAIGYYMSAFFNTAGEFTRLKNLIDAVKEFFSGDDISIPQPSSSSDNWLKPYDGLYSLDEPTGFEYLLPYFDNKATNDIQSSYSDISAPLGNFADPIGALSKFTDIASSISKLLVSPGQYVERPKLYDIQASSKQTITFSFPLLNTLNFKSAVKNYQLLWLLSFQNIPQRVTKSIVELPKIYEINVPGVSYIRFGYLESMSVKFIGNRRNVTIPMPSSVGLSPQITAIMPDAYNVEMRFSSLTINAANMMLENWNKSS